MRSSTTYLAHPPKATLPNRRFGLLRIAMALVLIQVSSVAFAADFPGFERLLLPVIVNKPIDGVGGARWQTVLTLTNASSIPQKVLLLQQLQDAIVCMLCPPETTVPPNFTYFPKLATVREGGGAFIYIDRAHADDVQLDLRAQDVSRPDTHWGTALPVVRDRNFRDGSVTLSDLPVSQEFRSRIRVYGADVLRPVGVRFTVWGIPNRDVDVRSGDQLLGTIDYSLLPQLSDPGFPNQFSPSTLEVANIESALPAMGYTRLRIDIAPRVPGTRIWAFATVTSNQTQQISVIEPFR